MLPDLVSAVQVITDILLLFPPLQLGLKPVTPFDFNVGSQPWCLED